MVLIQLEIGAGTAHGTTAAITIDSSADMTLGGRLLARMR